MGFRKEVIHCEMYVSRGYQLELMTTVVKELRLKDEATTKS